MVGSRLQAWREKAELILCMCKEPKIGLSLGPSNERHKGALKILFLNFWFSSRMSKKPVWK